MKLLYCGFCKDVVALRLEPRACFCGRSSGHYREDGLHAVISGDDALPLGFANSSFRAAREAQPDRAPGKTFEAFVIEKNCPTVEWWR